LKRVAILPVEILTVFIITMLPTARLWTASTAFFLITTTWQFLYWSMTL